MESECSLSASIDIEVDEFYREEGGGAYLPANGSGADCYHVLVAGVWWELYDFNGVDPVTTVYYGQTANREALGRPCKAWELPARILERVAELRDEAESSGAT